MSVIPEINIKRLITIIMCHRGASLFFFHSLFCTHVLIPKPAVALILLITVMTIISLYTLHVSKKEKSPD